MYKQYDSRWGSKSYAGDTMAGSGCGPCAVANIVDDSPVIVANWMTAHGYASNGNGTYWGGIKAALDHYGYNTIWHDTMANALEAFANGSQGVLLFRAGTKGGVTWTMGGHYVAVLDCEKKGSDYILKMADSGGRNHDGWYSYNDTMRGLVAQVWSCKKNVEGWKHNSTGWWYLNSDGTYPENKWQLIKGEWYYFGTKGYMKTGWLKYNNHWFYLKDSGKMQRGWLKYNDNWYYFDENGYMRTGWLKYNGYWFYFMESGEMKTGWIHDGNKWYWCDTESGKMITDQFKYIDGDWYRFAKNGVMLENTTILVSENGKII